MYVAARLCVKSSTPAGLQDGDGMMNFICAWMQKAKAVLRACAQSQCRPGDIPSGAGAGHLERELAGPERPLGLRDRGVALVDRRL